MSEKLTINTDALHSSAAAVNSNNNQLRDVLAQSIQTVQSVGGGWTGRAANAAVSAYMSFKGEFDKLCNDLNEDFVFLGEVSGAGYDKTESDDLTLAESMRC